MVSYLCCYDNDTYRMKASINCEGRVTSLCFVDKCIVLAGVDRSEMMAVDVQIGEVINKYDGKYEFPSIATRARPEPVIMVCVCCIPWLLLPTLLLHPSFLCRPLLSEPRVPPVVVFS